MEQLKRQRSTIKRRITRVKTFLDACLASPDQVKDKHELLRKIESIDTAWSEYMELHSKIIEAVEEAHIEVEEADFEDIESKYDDTKIGLTRLLAALQPATTEGTVTVQTTNTTGQPSSSTVADVKLPRMDLPGFSGNQLEWQSFRDLFKSIIHTNAKISNAQKLHYLKNSLKGEAGEIIHSIDVTDANYEIAWDHLTERYENERQLIYAHLHMLFSQSKVSSESAGDLRKLLDTTTKHLRSLKSLGFETDHWDPITVYLIVDRLDADSRRQWELNSPGKDYPNLGQLKIFLEQRCRALEATATTKPKQGHKVTESKNSNQMASVKTHVTTTTTCPICKEAHYTTQCPDFNKSEPKQRGELVKRLNLCFNCLRPGHPVKQCKSESRCKVCSSKHHTHLHLPNRPQSSAPQPIAQATSGVSTHLGNVENDYHVMLSTVTINVKNYCGDFVSCRALLDSGSQATLITNDCIQRLGLRRSKSQVAISGIGHSESGNSRGKMKLIMHSRISDFSIGADALILPKFTSQQPSTVINIKDWEFVKDLKLADESFYKPGPIDVIIGADVFEEIVTEGKISSQKFVPTARHTKFGWTFSGKVGSLSNDNITIHVSTVDISDQLKQFWELEDVGDVRNLTMEEQESENHFMKNYSRDLTGRFTVSLPIKQNDKTLGVSRDMCVKRLEAVERRLERNPEYKEKYHAFMNEYLRLGHMEKIPATEIQEIPNETNYLPHHFVLKESSSTTSFRVVFDASAKTSTGVSLNDQLMVGPCIQDDMYDILLRFRLHKYVFTADIAKMYRQILVTPSTANLQRILWRDDPSKPIQDYRLLTVTYGTASAPFLATRVLKQLALEEGENFPLALKTMLKDFYVDDVMSGKNKKKVAIQTRDEMIDISYRGGFQLRKWWSNLPELLENLPPGYTETNPQLEINSDDSIKALGLHWSPTGDFFTFKVTLPSKALNLTKRTILSETAKLFDPLGWLAPVIILAKSTLQQLWLLGVSWDDPLPQEVQKSWSEFRGQLPQLENLQIQRCVSGEDNCIYQLHGFCDASDLAYAAAVYLRTQKQDGTVTVHLLTAKTRVAPVKKISTPRLELCGAVLVARLLCKVKKSLNIEFESTTAWTDSTITLAWISALPNRWVTFVANRVSEIQSLISPACWRYVPTKQNPADCASRGMLPEELLNFTLWWTGPDWLTQDNTFWPVNLGPATGEIPEQRKIKVLISIITPQWDLGSQYSSVNKLKRVTAYCKRFIHNSRTSKEKRTVGPLTVQELQNALYFWIFHIQQHEFQETLSKLKSGKEIHNSLSSLNPFLDAEGILRVGGRLRHSTLPQAQKFPILLPKSHHLTKLIVIDEHVKHLHGGSQLTLNAVRQNYWVINGRSLIRQVIHKCVTCTRDRGMSPQQQMGDLPAYRVESTTPFLRTGMDFGGPFILKTMKGRGSKSIKAYIFLFVCLSTKAVHIELVGDLTAESTIAAMRRFTSRRGKPSDVYSDNGTNFTGANSELRQLAKLVSSHPFQDEMTNLGIAWHFIPARAPHFGGLWEAGIKSTKGHLRRYIGEQTLTFEEMSTVLAQVEACLNSRPLCPLSTDPNDLDVLTPGHFLIGRPLTAVADPDLSHLKINRLSRWQMVQRISQQFWNRWHTEYLVQLQQRNKWTKKKDNIKVGQLVLIKEENVCPQKWPMGRIDTVFPGKDGLIRAVTVKTSTGTITRPIVKLCLLPNDS